jgi:hypothetical protein
MDHSPGTSISSSRFSAQNGSFFEPAALSLAYLLPSPVAPGLAPRARVIVLLAGSMASTRSPSHSHGIRQKPWSQRLLSAAACCQRAMAAAAAGSYANWPPMDTPPTLVADLWITPFIFRYGVSQRLVGWRFG